MDSPNVATIWQRWHAFAAKHTPKMQRALQGAADDVELGGLAALGFALPDALIDSLRIHNGQRPDAVEDFLAGGGRLLSASEMVAHRDMLREALAGLQVPEDEDAPAQTGVGPVRALSFCERWLPIADCNGDVTWFLDFDPLPTGRAGQVIRVDLESGEWLVCADSYALFLEGYVRALEDGRVPVRRGRLQAKSCWPPIELLPYLGDSVLDEARVLEVGRAGRWDVARELATKLATASDSLLLRVIANAEYQKGSYGKARKALESLRALGVEDDADRWLLLDVLEAQAKRPALQAELDAQIARKPSARLYARRAALHREMAIEPVRKGGKAEIMEWLASPAGQQHHAVCLERAVADYRSARAEQDRDEWRLEEGDCLLDMQRWEEAEALFGETVDRMQTALGGVEPEAWSQPAFRLESAREGLRRAQTQDEGEDEAMLEGVDDLLAMFEQMGQSDGAEELRSVRDTFGRLLSQEAEERAEREGDVGRVDRDAQSVAEQIMARHPDKPERLGPYPLELLDRKAAKFYDKARDKLIALGFEHMGDVEPLNHSEMSGMRVMVRMLRSPDKRTVAAVWRLAGPFSVVEAVELESLLEDHSIVLTNNTGAANPFAAPPLIAQESLPQDCTLPFLVETHMNRLQNAPSATVPIRDMEGVVALQERQRVIKRDHAREQGWISDAELRGLLGGSYRELGPRVQALLREMH